MTVTEDRFDPDAFYPYNGADTDRYEYPPCPVCGTTATCGYDTDGRPYLHINEDDR